MAMAMNLASCGITRQAVAKEINDAIQELTKTEAFKKLETAVKNMVFDTMTEGIKWCWEKCKEFVKSHPTATCFAVFIFLVLIVAADFYFAGGAHTIAPLKEIFSEVAATLWKRRVEALNAEGLSAVSSALTGHSPLPLAF